MEHREWLTINYTLPKEPSRARVSVWRKLKRSGAVILGQSVWLLPVNEANAALLKEVSAEILQSGGVSYVATMTPHDEGTSERIAALFNQARDEEYGEFLEQCDKLLRELDSESDRGKFTFAELEENEEDFKKLTDWHGRITGRDSYGASLRAPAAEKLEQCRERLQAFSSEVYRHSDKAHE